MKIKLDENIPSELADLLRELGHDADTVESEGIKGYNDNSLWDVCKAERRFLITQDVAFTDARIDLGSDHPGVLVIRVREPGKLAVIRRVMDVFENEKPSEWANRIAIASPNKVRVRSR